MAVLATGASASTFKLDGNEYSKGLYETFYKNISTLPDGESDEKTLEVGLINVNTGIVIQEPIQIRAWKDGAGTPYLTLDSLTAALANVAGLGTVHSAFSPGKTLPGIPFKMSSTGALQLSAQNAVTVFDYAGYGTDEPSLVELQGGQNLTVTAFLNWQLADKLEDAGTAQAVVLSGLQIADTVLDDFFTQLPVTTKTVTINISGTSGTATCDPSIATAKGYTVTT